jgi:hypothetical protein
VVDGSVVATGRVVSGWAVDEVVILEVKGGGGSELVLIACWTMGGGFATWTVEVTEVLRGAAGVYGGGGSSSSVLPRPVAFIWEFGSAGEGFT